MSRRKTERLLSLVVCLLSSQRYLTATQIRAAVPGYPDSFDAFKRMFERDKEELRELGIPLEMGTNAAARRGDRLPDSPAGLRCCPRSGWSRTRRRCSALAARVWRRAELAGAAAGALLKLRAAGVEAEETAPAGHRAAAADRGGGVRPAVGGGPGPAAGHLPLPGGRAQRAAAAPAGALGRGEPARPLVRGRARPGAGRGAGVPAEPDRRRGGRSAGPPRIGDRARRGPMCGNWSGSWDAQPVAQQAAVLSVRAGTGLRPAAPRHPRAGRQ